MPSDRIPRSTAEIVAAAAARGLTIPPECLEGVAANLALLARHAQVLHGPACDGAAQ
ncbi:AtzG-like protein [Novosphingobium clariflavum]|uniref:AtzG-like protein n=1 Tax=Novosphingobium clariflavum TaxID=2029884 RepID=A0ABV6SDJ6_9SPHN|nr:AtzG-like protein [Novosphingobium clariflavum]